MSYDSKCYQLAALFLSDELEADHPRFAMLADRLAQQIQDAVEGFIQYDELMVMTTPRKEPRHG